MRIRRLSVALLLAVCTVLAPIGVSAAGAATSAPITKGGSLTWAFSTEPSNYDVKVPGPGATTNTPYFQAVYDSLMVFDAKQRKPVPRLLQSLDSNKDATVWTLKLRPNIKFSDGTSLDAAAIKASWDRNNEPAQASQLRATLQTFTSWTVQDPLTLVVTLPRARGSFPYQLTLGLGAIPSPTAVAKFGATYGSSPSTTVGAGPFVLKEWIRNSQTTFARNPNYWDTGKPYLDTLVFKIIPDPATKTDAMATNTVQLAFMSTADTNTEHMKNDLKLPYTTILGPNAPGALFNVSKAPLDDIRVRRALILASDPVDINKKATGGFAPLSGGPGSAFYPKSSPLYDKSVTQKTNDLAAAQKLIDAYVAEKGGPVKVSVLTPNVTQLLGTSVVQSWSRLNNVQITADIQTATQSVALLSTANYQAAAVTTPVFSYPDQWQLGYYTGVPTNLIKYSNPKMDKLIDEGFGYSDLPRRKKSLNDIARVALDDALMMRVYYIQFYMFAQKGVGGLQNQIAEAAFPDPTTLSAPKK